MVLKKGSKWSNWSWDKPVKAFIWRSSRICRPIGRLPPGFFEESLPHSLLRNNSIEEYGKANAEWLGGLLDLPHGMPGHETFRRVLSHVDPEELTQCFIAWTNALS